MLLQLPGHNIGTAVRGLGRNRFRRAQTVVFLRLACSGTLVRITMTIQGWSGPVRHDGSMIWEAIYCLLKISQLIMGPLGKSGHLCLWSLCCLGPLHASQ